MARKRILRIGLILLLAVALGGNAAWAQTKFITIATASTAGTFYAVGTILANTFNQTLSGTRVKWSAQSSGGSLENLQMLRNEEVPMALAGSAPTNFAYNGLQRFKGKAVKNIRYVTALWPEFIQFVYRVDSGIKKWEDLKGRKVAVGPPAGGGTFYGPIILKAMAGLTFDDIKPQYLSYGDSSQALQNGLIDAFYGAGGIPTSAVTQAYASRTKVDILEVSPEQFDRLKKAASYFVRATLPKKTYPGQDHDLYTAAMKSSLLALPSVSDDLVYKMLQVMYEKKLKALQEQHFSLSFLAVEKALEGLAGPPLHPGAVKFYQEHKVQIPAELLPK
jgi:TRAP transporter TAXI family solute receptor